MKADRIIQAAMIAFYFMVLSLPIAAHFLFEIAPDLKNSIDVPLSGVVIPKEKPSFSWDSFWSGKYQDKFNGWYARNFHFRPLLIKLNNQMFYDLFNKSYMFNQEIIIGKEGQLYEKKYINEFCNFSQRQSASEDERLVGEMAEMQDLLRQHGITFLVLISPSKASIYPEFIPDDIIRHKKEAGRSYDSFLGLFKKYKIQYTDGHDITVAAKGKTTYPLFCRGGIHWNNLGVFFTAEEMIRELEILQKEEFDHIHCKNVAVDYKPEGTDRDLADLLNLVKPPVSYPVPRPEITAERRGVKKYNAVFIGGSFNWVILDFLHKNNVFNDIEFYYYYNHGHASYPSGRPCSKDMNDNNIDVKKDFLSKDIVILEVNEFVMAENMFYAKKFVEDTLEQLKAVEPKPSAGVRKAGA